MPTLLKLAGAAALVLGLALGASLAVAEDATAVDPDIATGDPVMDAILAKEKEARKSCKIDICSIMRNKKAEGPDVACNIVQTWPKPALDKMLKKSGVSWPWSHVHCTTAMAIKRKMLVSAMTEAKYEATFDPHTLDCEINRDGADKYHFKVTLTPKVTYENGKATAAQLQWGEVEAPLLAKGVIWPITGLDNKTGVLSGQFIKMVNQFADKKCDEVKDQLK